MKFLKIKPTSAKVFLLASLIFSVAFNAFAKDSPIDLHKQHFPVPIAKPQTYSYKAHGIEVSDPWRWLRDSNYPNTKDPKILDYLQAENAYFGQFKQQNNMLIETLYGEFKGRIDATQKSVPWIKNGYEYRWEYLPDQEYRTWYRRQLNQSQETVFLDENQLAKGQDYFVLGGWDISPDNQILAYSVDTKGDERYQILLVDLTTGKHYSDKLENTDGSVNFSSDNKQLIFGLLEVDKWRIKSINAYVIGEQKKSTRVIVAEGDDAFFLNFELTRDNQYFIIYSSTSLATEASVIAADLSGEVTLLVDRQQNFRFNVEHAHRQFYILANDQHVNFRLATVTDDQPEYKNWKTLIAGSDDKYLRDFAAFDKFIAIKQNVNSLEQIMVLDYANKTTQIQFPENLCTVSFADNPEFSQQHLRVSYESMITPESIYDYTVSSKQLDLRKLDRLPSGYDKSQYVTKRIMAKARDGVEVPVSLVYRKDTKLDGSSPLHLYAYGAYGYGMEAGFSALRLSLLDRGVIFAIAHVRGGDEKGYQWYLDGKLEKRTNTFNDFIDVARHLISQKYTAKGNISISGRSAGGELMGAATVLAPELWASVNLGVPFVDVLNTTLDASLPLTPPEWSEWGNPITDKTAFEYIYSYSPYDNIAKTNYPPMLVTGGLNDPRVTYWEPAKWTAKMREYKTDNNLLLMRINMGAGHFANSGRYGRLKDFAEEYAFILLSHKITQ